MTDLRTFDAIGPGDVGDVGGKGLSLGRMAAAGLPVPPGFCVTTAAHRRLRGRTPHDDPALAATLADAYRRLGGGAVAVRSSATAEDGDAASFAGQQETVLGVRGEVAVADAVARCWASLDSERAVAYRRRQGVAGEGLAMAVVVQRLVPGEVAGVLFTRDPLDPEGRRMLVEASWGLGESVVSGRVTPDRFHLDRDTGAVRDRHVAAKVVEVTPDGERPVPADRRDVACLDDARLAELAGLGRRVEEFYGAPRDVEWAWAEGQFWLLQARPITAADAAEREKVRREEVAALAAKAEPGGTVWGRFNLSEVLPEPTPMTWAVVRRFLSGRGGYGLMYRDLGFRPDPSLDEDGVYDLVAGRPYCNLSREPRLYSGWLPYEHPFAALKADPRKALYPQAVRCRPRGGVLAWLALPLAGARALAFAVRLGNVSRTFADRFRQEILPPFVAEAGAAAAEDLGKLDDAALLGRLDRWVRRTLVDFARHSLKPTALAGIAMTTVERALARRLGPERAGSALGGITVGVRPDPEADLAGAVHALATGGITRADFLQAFGHRGSQEMELAQPRWAEDPAAVDRLIASAPPPTGGTEGRDTGPGWEGVVAEAKLSAFERATLEPQVEALQTYLGLRETAKHFLMLGYAEIRRTLVELDRRHGLGGGIFFLTLEELPRLAAGEDLAPLIAGRRRRRSLVLSLEVPPVLFCDDLEAVGRPPGPVAGADTLRGVPLSAGVAEAPALVLDRPPTEAPAGDGYILVCPSTDPAWVPLFVRARGLVMETGGVLSHGAIVAREFGLPAVAGLAGVVRRLRTGQRLRVDGAGGTVTVLPD
jgi:pyruvate,water dikinase